MNIGPTKNSQFAVIKAKYCPSGCKSHNCCSCDIIAEVMAWTLCTIPEEYRQYTIDNFTGMIDDKQVVPISVARKAKEQIARYCYNSDLSGLQKPGINITDMSIKAMNERKDNGNNLVIFSDADGKSGRSMIAAIALKEAIKSKADNSNRNMQSKYGWVEYTKLKTILKNSSMNREDNGVEAVHYQSCDWLVVDNISQSQFSLSSGSIAFDLQFIDPFFFQRIEQKLITILVFRTELEMDIEKYLGPAINRIVTSKNTCVISLCPDNRRGNNER